MLDVIYKVQSAILIFSRGFVIRSLEIKAVILYKSIDFLFNRLLPASVAGLSIKPYYILPRLGYFNAILEDPF